MIKIQEKMVSRTLKRMDLILEFLVILNQIEGQNKVA